MLKKNGAELHFYMCLARALTFYTLGVVRATFNTCDRAKGFPFLCSKVSEPQGLIPEVSMALAVPPQGPVSALSM